MTIDFTITAVVRPDLLYRTLRSFRSNLLGVDWEGTTVYVNVDRVPAGTDYPEIFNVAGKFFGFVRGQTPETPSFPAAVKWCFAQPRTKYFFHLEDDWLLSSPVDITDMARILDERKKVAVVNLRAYRWPQCDTRICLSPGLWRTADARMIASRLTLDWNPERQLRPVDAANPHGGRHEGYKACRYPPDDPNRVVIYDIGRDWMDQHGHQKNGGVEWTKWEDTAPMMSNHG